MLRILPAILLLVAGAFAGCTEPIDDKTGLASQSLAPAPVPTVGESTGSIRGTVVDDESVPVVSANVGVVELPQVELQTDAQGRFVVNGLEGGSYSVIVQRLGWKEAAKRVTVTLGEVTEVHFVLERIHVSEPRAVTYIGAGYLHFAWAFPFSSGTIFHPNATGQDTRQVYYRLDPDPASTVAAIQWQPTFPATAKWMSLGLLLTKKNCADLCKSLTTQAGVSPVTARSDDLAEHVTSEGVDVSVHFRLSSCFVVATSPGNCTAHPDAVVPVAIQQKVSMYTTVFYVDVAPVGYSPLPK